MPSAAKAYELEFASASKSAARVFLLAGDLGDPLAGNKYLKLEPWLQRVARDGYKGLIGVGGAWSNFILSLALASKQAGIASVGIIRGAEHQSLEGSATAQATAMLQDACLAEMKLHFVSRAEFKRREEPAWQEQWTANYPGYLFVPEGGSSIDAARACHALLPSEFNATDWVIAAGTGATAAGVAAATRSPDRLWVINLSGDPQLQQQVLGWRNRLLREQQESDLHGAKNQPPTTSATSPETIFPIHEQPRFGKLSKELCGLANDCFEQTGVLLDPVYTVKAMQQVQWMLQRGEFAAGARIALIHTGGLQGWRGYLHDYGKYLSDDVLETINSLYPLSTR